MQSYSVAGEFGGFDRAWNFWSGTCGRSVWIFAYFFPAFCWHFFALHSSFFRWELCVDLSKCYVTFKGNVQSVQAKREKPVISGLGLGLGLGLALKECYIMTSCICIHVQRQEQRVSWPLGHVTVHASELHLPGFQDEQLLSFLVWKHSSFFVSLLFMSDIGDFCWYQHCCELDR